MTTTSRTRLPRVILAGALVLVPLEAEDPPDFEALRVKASIGDLEARYQLGRACLRGEGVPRNLPEAHALLKAAAEAGHAEAQGAYGYMLARGLGAPLDETAGCEWIKKSAETGVVSSQLNLGIMTLRGQGTPRDPSAGLTLIQKAAEQGNLEAQVRLAEAYYFGEDGLIPKSPEKAAPWALKAAERGSAWAQNLVGNMKEHGLGVPRDPAGAVSFFRKAAAQGEAKAQANLGRLLHSGLDVTLDRSEAYYWLRASGDQGEVTGRNLFAELEAGFTKEEKEAAEQRLKDKPPPRATTVRKAGPGPPIPR
jgi:TPR repeat protein